MTEDGRRQAVLVSILTAARYEPALRTAARDALGSPYSTLFEHVVSRGQIAQDVDITTIGEIFPAIAFHYAAALWLPIDEEIILRVIDGVLLPALRVTGSP